MKINPIQFINTPNFIKKVNPKNLLITTIAIGAFAATATFLAASSATIVIGSAITGLTTISLVALKNIYPSEETIWIAPSNETQPPVETPYDPVLDDADSDVEVTQDSIYASFLNFEANIDSTYAEPITSNYEYTDFFS